MARGPQDRWLLLRLAAQNVGRRRLRAILLAAAVMLGVGDGFAGCVTGWALSNEIAASLARMGADLLVVPHNTLVNITASLLTVQPIDATLPSDLADKLSVMPGVARVAPQRIVPVLVDGRPTNLIAFDPMRDFSVLPWIDLHQEGPLDTDGVVAGARVSGEPGGEVVICGKPMRIYGRLERTGVGPFDESWFVSFDGLGDIAAFCRANRATAAAGAKIAAGESGHHVDGQACLPDTRLDRVSAFLLQLAPGAKIDEVRFALGQLPGVRIVEGNTVLTTSRQALSALLAVVQLGEGDFGIGVDHRLLIDPAHPLQSADIEGVLGTAITWAFAVELAVRFLVGFGFLEGGDLRLGQQDAILRHLGFEGLQAQLH